MSGLGADELFCGYSQHRRIHDREGMQELAFDVQNMIERIGERNCARDDRVISDSGAEYRLPFLDLDFIHTGNQRTVVRDYPQFSVEDTPVKSLWLDTATRCWRKASFEGIGPKTWPWWNRRSRETCDSVRIANCENEWEKTKRRLHFEWFGVTIETIDISHKKWKFQSKNGSVEKAFTNSGELSDLCRSTWYQGNFATNMSF